MDENKVPTAIVDKINSIKELQEYARAQFLTLLQANKRIEQLESENRQLKAQVETLPAKVDIIPRSPEQDVCEIEIKRLRDVALGRPLDLEETKRLDILVKTLYLAKGKPKGSIEGKSKKLPEISEAELIEFATLVPNKDS